MKLRTHLMVSVLATVIPLTVIAVWAQVRWHGRIRQESWAEAVRFRMDAGGRERCEARPETWPGQADRFPTGGRAGRHGRHRARRPRTFAYSDDFKSFNPDSPRFPSELARAIRRGEPFAYRARPGRGRGHEELAVAMPWQTGPCAVLLLRGPSRPGPGYLAALSVPLLVALAAGLVALFAAGPLVRRLRALTDAVRSDKAELPVEGSDELSELAQAFRENRRQIDGQLHALEEREVALRDYIGNTTHDVMLPITVLQGHLVELQQRLEAGTALGSEELTPALEECQYLSSMLHNLNAAARLKSQGEQFAFSTLDLNRLVERVAERHRPIARRKGVELDFATPDGRVSFEGDVTLLEQAISNLVHNAVRYNSEGGHVALLLDGETKRWSIGVRDDGPGIAAEELKTLFERGVRGGAARTRHPHGMGLGLHIAKSVADRHKLELSVDSVVGQGTTITLRPPPTYRA